MRIVQSRSATPSTCLIRNASVTEPGWRCAWSAGCNICERNGTSRVSGRSPRQPFRNRLPSFPLTRQPRGETSAALCGFCCASTRSRCQDASSLSLPSPAQQTQRMASPASQQREVQAQLTGSYETPSDGRCGLFADRIGRGSQLLCSQAGKEGSEQILTHEKPKQTPLVQSRIDTRHQLRMSSRELAPM